MIGWLYKQLSRVTYRLKATPRKLADWWVDWRTPCYPTTAIYAELPKQIEPNTIYVVEEDGFQEQAAMLCPCGCGRTLHMNLLRDERPCWTLTQHEDGSSSLHPSVWRQKDCGSHFWLRKGRVKWARSYF